MNILSKSLLSIATFALAGQVFAAKQSQPQCLPPSVIANTTFIKAIKNPNLDSKLWAVVSDNFSNENNDWNVVLAVTLTDITDSAEALEKGKTIFKTIPLKEAQPVVYGRQLLCQYASLENEYVLLAASPPINIDVFSLNVAKN